MHLLKTFDQVVEKRRDGQIVDERRIAGADQLQRLDLDDLERALL